MLSSAYTVAGGRRNGSKRVAPYPAAAAPPPRVNDSRVRCGEAPTHSGMVLVERRNTTSPLAYAYTDAGGQRRSTSRQLFMRLRLHGRGSRSSGGGTGREGAFTVQGT